MTKNEPKYGCLSKSLVKFLSIRDHEKRKKLYGSKTAKYYERVVKSVNESFDDQLKAFTNLPDEYRKKIDFTQHYDNFIYTAITKKWLDKSPNTMLKELRDHLIHFQMELARTPYDRLAKDDFKKVEEWLYVLDPKLKLPHKKKKKS